VDILRVLGEIRSDQWKAPLSKILIRYLSHNHPGLRAQALHTLCQIDGSEAEEVSIKSLKDPSLEVRRRAIWCLGMIKSARGLEEMVDFLEKTHRI
jgi:HEAT repeat protein